MKSNFGKKRNAKDENDNDENKKIYLDGLSAAERNKIYSKITKEAYANLIKSNGEEKILQVFEYMLSDDFVIRLTGGEKQKNKRLIKEVKTAVNYTVKRMLYDYVEQQMVEMVETRIKSGKSKKEIISEIQNSEDYKDLLKFEDKSNEFYKTVIEQIKKSVESQVDIIEEKAQKEKVKEEIKKEKDGNKEEVNNEAKEDAKEEVAKKDAKEEVAKKDAKEEAAKKDAKEEVTKEEVAKGKIRNRKEEERNKKEVEDEKFLEEVAKYTDGYKFLASSRFIYIAQNGNMYLDTDGKKFKNVDRYYRFMEIQDKLHEIMTSQTVDEMKAINILLKGEVSDVERKILSERKNMMLNEKKCDQEELEI